MTPTPTERTKDRITIEPTDKAVNVTFRDVVIASTRDALVLSEKGHDPVYYVPKDHVAMDFLRPSDRRTSCPWKGEARYWSITAGAGAAPDAVWAYDEPHEGVGEIAGYVAFDPEQVRITTA